MNKQSLLILIILLVPLAYSAEPDWLISKSSANNWNNNIQDTSLALLSLKDTDYSKKQETITWLEGKMNSCIASDSCSIKDASFALLALNEMSSSSTTATKLKNWMLNASTFQYSGETAGWKAQIISTVSGSCTISDPNNPSQSQIVSVSSQFTPWADIASLISTATNSINIDCTSLSSAPISLSLIREASATRYYINKEITNQKEITLDLGYPCWGTTSHAGSCDKESTAFALFALEPAADPKWLEKQDLTPLQNALLYSVTSNNKYLTEVLDDQNRLGYWGSANLFETAFISLVIPDSDKRTKALNWIASQKAATQDCWPKPESLCNVKSTAVALLNQLSENTTSTTNTTLGSSQTEDRREQNEERGGTEDCPEDSSCITSDACPGTCDYWGLCQDDEGDNCPEGDTIEQQEACEDGSVCTIGGCAGTCDAFGDCIDDAEDNCTPKTTNTTTPRTTEEGSSVLFWILMVLLLLIIVAGGGYLAYKKGLLKFKKKPFKPSSGQTYRHPMSPASQIPQRRTTITHPVKGRIQHDLDSSISEMEKFLKGKKK